MFRRAANELDLARLSPAIEYAQILLIYPHEDMGFRYPHSQTGGADCWWHRYRDRDLCLNWLAIPSVAAQKLAPRVGDDESEHRCLLDLGGNLAATPNSQTAS